MVGRDRAGRKERSAAGNVPRKTKASARHMADAVAAYRGGRLDAALKSGKRALKAEPRHVEALNLVGMLETRSGNTETAIRQLKKARRLAPEIPEIAENLAQAYCALGDLASALSTYQAVVEQWPDRVGAWCNLGNVAREFGRPELARWAYKEALSREPRALPALVNLALLEGQSGNRKKAVDLYRRCLELAPDDGELYHGLSVVKRFTTEDPDIAEMESRRKNGAAEGADRMFLGFALAKAYEDIGEYNRAFARLAEANQIKRRNVRFDCDTVERQIDEIKRSFLTEARSQIDTGCDSEQPVFVFGMPRSGTSLVEQIISNHSAAEGAGELSLLWDVAMGRAGMFGGIAEFSATGEGFPRGAGRLEPEALTAIGRQYVNNLPPDLRAQHRVVDKMPRNFLFAGLIRRILPKARMIHCVRSPLDTCFSCFALHFPYGQEFSYDLTELGRYYRAYHRLCEHWRNVLGSAILEVRYEDMVTNPQTETGKILEYCDLQWEDACLEFHCSKRHVKTASAQQVHQPIYDTSIGRWRRFQSDLGPLIDALGDLADIT